MPTLEELQSLARGIGDPATFQNALVSSKRKEEMAEEVKQKKKKKKSWDLPLEIDSVSDIYDPSIIESLTKPKEYNYSTKKSMKNFRKLFVQYIEALEDLE